MVVTVNVRQMLQTPVLKKHALDPLKLVLQRNAELRQLLTAAGLDPLKDIDTIGLSTSGSPGMKGKMLAVVRGSFDPDKVRTAADDYAKKHPDRLKDLKVGELPVWEITADNKSFFAAFAGKNVLVMTTSKEDTAAAVHRAERDAPASQQGHADRPRSDPGWRERLAGDGGDRPAQAAAQGRRQCQELRRLLCNRSRAPWS